MDKKLAEQVIRKAHGQCVVCGRPGQEIHHSFGGRGRRKQTEIIECLYYLCVEHHRGNTGVHNNRKLDIKLKQKSQQELLDQGYTLDEVREITGGQIYL